jgi:hypothetical protein
MEKAKEWGRSPDSERGMKGLHFVLISFFVEAEYTAKSDVVGGGDFGFS